MRQCIYFNWLVLLCTVAVSWSYQGSENESVSSFVDTVGVRIPNVWAMPGDTIPVPILLIDDVTHLQVLSIQLDLSFDPDIISIVGDSLQLEGTITAEWALLFEGALIDTNDTYTFRMVWAAVDSLTGRGLLVNVPFRVLPTVNLGGMSPLQLEVCFFNEGNPACHGIDGILTVGESPRIELSEEAHNFGSIIVGQSAEWDLHISNVGGNILDVYSLESDNAQFEVISPSFPQSIDSGASIDATVSFQPDSEDSLEGNLRLSCNDLDNLILDISLKGNGETRVFLSSFSANWQAGNIILRWTTYDETDHLGFFLYRSRFYDKDFQRVSSDLIVGESPYLFRDRIATNAGTYFYRLNSLDRCGYEETVGFTSVKVSQAVPVDFSLSQNFPNPFNPITYIMFGIPGNEYITLTVYNAIGEEVRTLYEGMTSSGNHRVRWDGFDDEGSAMPSGIYFCRLQSSSVSLSIRMLLLR